MSSTRINNDIFRQEQKLSQSTGVGRYMLNVPGNGLENPYIDDVHIRLQQWGGNLMTDSIGLENKLFNIGKQNYNNYTNNLVKSNNITNNHERINYPINDNQITDDTRLSLPAWTLRDVETHITHKRIKQHVPVFNDDDIRNQQISTRYEELLNREY
jgi:hypothetical protein